MEAETLIDILTKLFYGYTEIIDTFIQMELKAQIEVLLVLLLVMSLISATFDAYRRRCPSCGKWRARKFVDEKELSSKVVYEDRPHTTHEYDAYGNKTGIIETTTRDPVVKTTYKVFYKCRLCNHKWEEIETRKS